MNVRIGTAMKREDEYIATTGCVRTRTEHLRATRCSPLAVKDFLAATQGRSGERNGRREMEVRGESGQPRTMSWRNTTDRHVRD